MPKKYESDSKDLKQEALRILESSNFFDAYFESLKRSGLTGEDRNAAVLLIAGVSRVLDKPLNVFIKGRSSSGKNYLAKKVLDIFPKDAVREITSSSEMAWNYSENDFRHRIVYVQERNRWTGPLHQVRLLISENKLIRTVTVMEGGRRRAKTFKTRGPIAALSTTTSNQLEIDDETRHISIWIDESPEQTLRIIKRYSEEGVGLIPKERRLWCQIHNLIQCRAAMRVVIPSWFDNLAGLIDVTDLRARRYFPAFLTACKTQALIGSFSPIRNRKVVTSKQIEVDFEDFAIAQIIFEPVFAESLHRGSDSSYDVRARLDRLTKRNGDRPVSAESLAKEMKTSLDKTYAVLREARESGAIEQVNKPERGNRKLYRAVARQEFIPNPDRVFDEITEVGDHFRFVHPLSGEWIEYRR